MLTERFPPESLRENLRPEGLCASFPAATDRKAWNALRSHPLLGSFVSGIPAEAERMLGEPWPFLPASLYMAYSRQGNRIEYETPYFDRRARLTHFVLAECLEDRGRFLDAIADGLWLIAEETTWCLPAHAFRDEDDPLPKLDGQHADLFVCETASTVALALHLLRNRLEALSPVLVERVSRAVFAQAIDPVEQRDDFWWMQGGNNWAPWCSENALLSAACLMKDRARLVAFASKLMTVVDRFIAGYGEDGGCDEGPMYWTKAAGAMLGFLELLHDMSGGAVSIYDNPLIRRMGEYEADMHLGNDWFVSAADNAGARLALPPGLLYRYGTRVASPRLQQLAVRSKALRWGTPCATRRPHLKSLADAMRHLFWLPPGAKAEELRHPPTAWYPDLQVLVAREGELPEQGLTLAAKAGHNAESHNHNDVGSFMVALDGQPMVIDLGVGEYTKDLFSSSRYTIWWVRSVAHDVPLVNGEEQRAGREFAAGEVVFRDEGTARVLQMELGSAYPPRAGIRSLHRAFVHTMLPVPEIAVTDTFLCERPPTIEIPFYCAFPVELGSGHVRICAPDCVLGIDYDSSLDVDVREMLLNEPKLHHSWGDRVWVATFTYRGSEPSGSYSLRFAKGDAG